MSASETMVEAFKEAEQEQFQGRFGEGPEPQPSVADQLGVLIERVTALAVEASINVTKLDPLEDRSEREEFIDRAKKLQGCLHRLFLALEELR